MKSSNNTERDYNMDNKQMLEAAKKASENAYAPYSHFKVGSAVLGSNGVIYTGCNFENASYGAAICAERCAIGKMVSDGCYKIDGVACYCESDTVGTSCGICRQVIFEFANGNIPVLFTCATGEVKEYKMDDLLLDGFRL